jgi:hypothetical protein
MGLSITPIGFGAAIVAGLVLAIIGHRLPQALPTPAPTSAPISANEPRTFRLKSVSVELPTSEVAFPGANAEAINANCLSCHSAGMVLTQPALAAAVWAGEVDKMIHAYKAPIGEGEVPAIVEYLKQAKGLK